MALNININWGFLLAIAFAIALDSVLAYSMSWLGLVGGLSLWALLKA